MDFATLTPNAVVDWMILHLVAMAHTLIASRRRPKFCRKVSTPEMQRSAILFIG